MRNISLLDTAKLVRQALKAQYPTIKFSVRTSRYSMGQSIDVTWTDGPTQAQVDVILKPFAGQRFDGTDDSTHRGIATVHGEQVHYQADYVTGQRTHSAAFLRTIADKVSRHYHVPCPEIRTQEDWSNALVGGYERIDHAPPFDRPAMLRDVISHVMHRTSALPKPRIIRMAEARQVA